MEASSSCARPYKTTSRAKTPIHSLDADLLCNIFSYLDHFGLVRCSAVCKSWNGIIQTSSSLKNLYYKKQWAHAGRFNVSIPRAKSLNACLEELALSQHRLSLQGGTGEVHQWNGHIVRARHCRMKMGSIVTGVGDKVLRMWSSENYKCLGEFPLPDMASLLDFDFDESKIVGLIGTRVCIWRHHGKRSIFPSKEGTFARGICMRYVDPEAVIGCMDGTVRVFDMYSQQCSQIIKLDTESVMSLALTDGQMIIGGNFLGHIKVADLSSGQRIAYLKTSVQPTGIMSLCFNPCSHFVFAGSTSGYSHCWDLRKMEPLWEKRVSPNVIYSVHHMWNDTSTLVVGGIDGVLRMLDQNTGKFLSSYITDAGAPSTHFSRNGALEKKRAKFLPEDPEINSIPTRLRPCITCVAVGMRKVVTTHNAKCIRVWKFKN